MARYAPRQWLGVSILMRESSYNILASLSSGPKSWSQLKQAAKLTDSGLQSALRQLIQQRVVEAVLVERKDDGQKDKRYVFTDKAKKARIYEKTVELRQALKNL